MSNRFMYSRDNSKFTCATMVRYRVGWDQTVALTSNGDRFRLIRRLLHDGMSPKVMQVSTIAPLQVQESIALGSKSFFRVGGLYKNRRRSSFYRGCYIRLKS